MFTTVPDPAWPREPGEHSPNYPFWPAGRPWALTALSNAALLGAALWDLEPIRLSVISGFLLFAWDKSHKKAVL